MKEDKQIAGFLFEVGTMRKLMRMHRQVLLTDDLSDSISSHSYRVAMIGWFLAKKEKADPYKTVMMCLLHDLAEARSGDHNWLHKRYVKVFEHQINEEQLGKLPFKDLHDFVSEYEKRQSKESILAKDADLLDQVLLLREYEWQGNREAMMWLRGRKGDESKARRTRLGRLKSKSARRLGEVIYDEIPSDWWNGLWTPQGRKD